MTSVKPSQNRPQFGLASMFWSMLAIGLVLATLRRINRPEVFLSGLIVIVIAVLVGLTVGWIIRRSADAAYWSVVITTAAFLSVAAERAYGPIFLYAWSAVGTVAGACGGVIAAKRLVTRMAIAGCGAGLTMLAFAPFLRGGRTEIGFDLVCAPMIGALVAVLIELVLWLERNSRIPRYITAAWLLCAVIIGNALVPLVNR